MRMKKAERGERKYGERNVERGVKRKKVEVKRKKKQRSE